ncbi:hypothetical protein, partial [Streptomyces sp. JJ36]|uniref:hypothetical protein n=1 Tax=Streptomyces sp. JJ36 TaxID=2736645 RepID=UPI001F30064C
MSSPMRHGPVEERALRRLLAEAGRPPRDGQPPGFSRVADLLRDLSGPSAGAEGTEPLRGEEAAVAAFRAAHAARTGAQAATDARPGTTQPRSAGLRLPGRLRTRTVAVGVAVAALLGSGVAVGAGLGPFAGPGRDGEDDPEPGPRPVSSPAPPSPPASRSTAPEPDSGTRDRTGAERDGGATGAAELRDLCRVWAERHGARPGALNRPGLRPLAEAAGGPGKVAGYCAERRDTRRPAPGPADTGGERGDGGEHGRPGGEHGRPGGEQGGAREDGPRGPGGKPGGGPGGGPAGGHG